jgi:hypothetical protein
MDSTSLDAPPGRMLSISEVLNLKNRVDAYLVTAPLLGLHSLEKGQATNSRAVIGLYAGVRGRGGHFMGFRPDKRRWEVFYAIDLKDVTDPNSIAGGMDTLLSWAERQFPSEKFSMYAKGSLKAN